MESKYIFLTLKSIETEFLYSGFNDIDNGQLIAIDRGKYINRVTRNAIKKYTQDGTWKILATHLTKRIVDEQIVNRLPEYDIRYIFIVYARVYESLGRVLTDEIKQKYPHAILCVYFADLQKRFSIDLSSYRRDFDYLFSFDKKQAEEYNLNYLLEPFTYKPMQEDEIKPIYDVAYVGRVKGDMKRHDQVMRVYDQCKKNGLKCDFHIVDVPKELQLDCDDIEYNRFMSFEEIMDRVIKSRTVLEILQTDEYSPTTRYSEACIYNRNIITNCVGVKDGFYKRDKNVFVLNDSSNIDCNWVKEKHEINSDEFIRTFSIESFIGTIEKAISGKTEHED